MKSIFVVLSVIVAVACAHKLTPCGRYGNRTYVVDYPYVWQKFNGERENPSSIYPDSSRCKSSKYRLCVISNKNSESFVDGQANTYEYSCAQCRTTCDCPSGYYCSNSDSESDDFGKCLSYKHKIGTFCNVDLGSPESLMVGVNITGGTAKQNETAFNSLYNVAKQPQNYCAIFHRNRKIGKRYEDYDVFSIEWMGVCLFNRCYACNSYYNNYKKPYTVQAYDNVDVTSETLGTYGGTVCSTPSAFTSSDYTTNMETSRLCYHNKISNGPQRL